MVINPSTELAAVNTIIESIGESPVNSLQDSTSVDVIKARSLLAQESRKVQDRGWTFNIDESATLVPDVFSKQITWSNTWLRVTTPSGTPYVNRNQVVYDRLNRTDSFEGPISVTLIEEWKFDELPYCFQVLITMRAARRFNANNFGDPGTDSELARQEAMAQQDCNEYELDYGDYNLFENDTYIQQRIQR